MKRYNNDLVIDLDKNYQDFRHFYDENKSIIYKSIIEIFEKFKTTKKKNLKLLVKAIIMDLEFETEFCYTKNENFVLTRDLMPYFEQIEDFETCARIRDLSKEFNTI
jgi:hypothetical protein